MTGLGFRPDVPSRVRVRVPATSANLGSAFDCAGLALQIYDDVALGPAAHDSVEVEGEGAGELDSGSDNLVLVAARRLYEAAGETPPRLHAEMRNGIPLGRGLGSSSAAIVVGLVAANVLLGSPFTDDALLEHAVAIEGHGDNVAAALYGGLTLYAAMGQARTAVRLSVPSSLRVVVYIPQEHVPTKEARAVLPATVPRADAVFNVARSALLVAALGCGRLEALGIAMEDRLHQPYRAHLYPFATGLIESALGAGALGSAVSGAGPTVIALAREQQLPAVQAALERSARFQGLEGRTVATGVEGRGAHVLANQGGG